MQHARLLGKNTKKDFHAASVQVQLFPRLEKNNPQEDESLDLAPPAIRAIKSHVKV